MLLTSLQGQLSELTTLTLPGVKLLRKVDRSLPMEIFSRGAPIKFFWLIPGSLESSVWPVSMLDGRGVSGRQTEAPMEREEVV